MNFIDIFVVIIAAIAIYNGWKRGAILQICTLVGIVIGIVLALRFATPVGEFLDMGESFVFYGGFAVVLLLTMVGVALIARLLRGVFRFAGLGMLDIIIGIALSLAKAALILGLVFTLFNSINHHSKFVEQKTLDESKCFYPICNFADKTIETIKDCVGMESLPSFDFRADSPNTPKQI